ncbi:MAG: hypothetical protein K8R53_12955 [Bacteroidales bacterium]|nr:hypothetical protein [Bacteroidales bacterium]
MKRAIRLLVVTAFLLAAPVFLLAQTPPHPNGGNAPGTGNTPVGGGAPIDGGFTIMLVLGAAYGAKKVFKLKK